ncbi:transporter [Algoriphagus chordae]|uniref:Outer membrane beta-barrel porin/alpha-amylase n=1 Tax=Algoriphagus chordae TaxID=237019 RepID=A0A2W7QX96_9BACT|nr:transporter [Algoriphagus chordae]PZX53148.1 hypothetical protein LV85_01563 [Algoriphagus chordae]
MKRSLLVITILFLSIKTFAQGDGPKSHNFAPTGIWGINPKYLHLTQNLVPSGTILVDGAEFTIDVAPITLFHTFGIKGRYARVYAMINPGSATGNVEASPGVTSINANGFADGFVAMELGLINSPALTIQEFSKHTPTFTMTGNLRLWYSGTYDSEKLLNLGTNRWIIEVGTPMNIPLSTTPGKATWLETYPYMQFYTDNNDPARSARAEVTAQKAMFRIENHLTHNFTPKLWASFDFSYQYGGRTVVDGVDDDNLINILGGGATVGYQVLPYLSAYVGYGTVFAGDNDANVDMFRFSVAFTYANMKK